ncbi:MAG TPA: hypothetical protein DGR97_08375 [Gammaproteobacteria bacterium]|nr:hypothetical protein [Gammaproteobacteria bacterium]
MNYSWKHTVAAATTVALSLMTAPLAFSQESDALPSRLVEQVDFIGAAALPTMGGIVVVGPYGMVGLLKEEDGGLRLHRHPDPPKEDFTAVAALSDAVALVGSSTGNIYSYDGTTLKKVAKLGEYEEPVLAIAVEDGGAWAVGGRGMVSRSDDGKSWTDLEIVDVKQPTITWHSGAAESWYFGISNIDPDTIKFTGNVGGKPAVDREHYEIFSEEGYLQNSVPFDMDTPPTIEYQFNPGPPFRPGDVTWNVVLLDGESVLIAGEFGLVLQSADGGDTWVRRDSVLVNKEPDVAYWLAGTQNGEKIILTGAAGVNSLSTDGGVSWELQPQPGNEGIFGISLLDNGDPIIAGAVGLIGTFDGNDWSIADRTRLKLLSWLKNPVPLQDGSVLMLGGRSTAINYKDGEWTRVPVRVE